MIEMWYADGTSDTAEIAPAAKWLQERYAEAEKLVGGSSNA